MEEEVRRWRNVDDGGGKERAKKGKGDGYWVLLFHFTFITETVEY